MNVSIEIKLKYFMILLLLNICSASYSQELIKFKSNSSNKYGLKNSKTGEIIAKPLYNSIFQFNDSLYIVEISSYDYGIVNLKGIIYEFKNTSLSKFDIKCDSGLLDSNIKLKLTSVPFFDPNKNTNVSYIFFVNIENQCIPNDYFPCAPYSNIIKDSIQEYLNVIQIGEKFLWQNKIDSAIICAKKAIQLAPENAYVYYWGANILIGHSDYFLSLVGDLKPVNSSNNSEYTEYYDWICVCLKKAEEIESRPYYALKIQRAKLKFYKNSLKDKGSIKLIKNKIKELENQTKNCG